VLGKHTPYCGKREYRDASAASAPAGSSLVFCGRVKRPPAETGLTAARRSSGTEHILREPRNAATLAS
jgi:hypothetical protein